MPKGEKFWNPYRWVEIPHPPGDYREPYYHHRFQGIAGNIRCKLTALTPLFVNDGNGLPCRRRLATGREVYVVPGTSLKGVLRSLAEIVGNGTGPFSSTQAQYMDPEHCVESAARGDSNNRWELDVIARTFGLLRRTGKGGSEVFRGHIRVSDALPDPPDQRIQTLPLVQLIGASPKPGHKAFYPDSQRRKLYHHQPGVESLPDFSKMVKQTQLSKATPLKPGCTFAFEVNFWNLSEEELGLLLYCLFLEEEVEVRLSKEAGGGEECVIVGPMRHRIGGAKPYGAGSVAIEPDSMLLCEDLAARYRGTGERWMRFEGDKLRDEIRKRTDSIRKRTDKTMQQLRAMLVYSPDDPRRPVHWPGLGWFRDHPNTPLKPTV